MSRVVWLVYDRIYDDVQLIGIFEDEVTAKQNKKPEHEIEKFTTNEVITDGYI